VLSRFFLWFWLWSLFSFICGTDLMCGLVRLCFKLVGWDFVNARDVGFGFCFLDFAVGCGCWLLLKTIIQYICILDLRMI
jgi:hypothetical protein